jgi:ribonuclease HIII
MNNQVISLTRMPTEADSLRDRLDQLSFEFFSANYAFWQAKGKKLTITFYHSGKLVVQGLEAQQFVDDFFPDVNITHGLDDIVDLFEWIGTDESGKGDYFGPLVVAAVHVQKNNAKQLTLLGVQDCKNLSDSRVIELAEVVSRDYPTAVIILEPENYNTEYGNIKNVNRLLADLHARVIDELLNKTKCNVALTDQFGNEKLLQAALLKRNRHIRLVQQHRAEANPAVAAASVVARALFLKSLYNLSNEFRINFPKGATHVVEVGKQFIAMYGKENLHRVAKMHFKTTTKLI